MSDWVRVAAIPILAKRFLIVSARIILYDKFPNQQSIKHENAIIQEVDFPTETSQASAYDMVLVDFETLPIRAKVYAEMTPMTAIKMTAGIMAEGAFPKATTPVSSFSIGNYVVHAKKNHH
jgi:hypothetical protein